MWRIILVLRHKRETVVLHFHKERSSRMCWGLKFIHLCSNPSRFARLNSTIHPILPSIDLFESSTNWLNHPFIQFIHPATLSFNQSIIHPTISHPDICWLIYLSYRSSVYPPNNPSIIHLGSHPSINLSIYRPEIHSSNVQQKLNPPFDISIHPSIHGPMIKFKSSTKLSVHQPTHPSIFSYLNWHTVYFKTPANKDRLWSQIYHHAINNTAPTHRHTNAL